MFRAAGHRVAPGPAPRKRPRSGGETLPAVAPPPPPEQGSPHREDAMRDPFGAIATLDLGDRRVRYFSLPALERKGLGPVSRLPVSLRIVLESLVRNLDGQRVREEDVRALAAWKPEGERTAEVPFVVP